MRLNAWTACSTLAILLTVGTAAGAGPDSAVEAVEPGVTPRLAPASGPAAIVMVQDFRHRDDAEIEPFAEEATLAPLPKDEAYDTPPKAIAPVPERSYVPSPVQDEAGEFGGDPCQACPADPQQPWHLPQPCAFQRAGITLGGWVQQGLTLNAQVPRDRFNGPVATNDRHAEWQVNQVWMFLNRPINTEGSGWDLGGRLDMIYGSDARFGVNWGLENRINGENQPYGLVIPQMYLEVGYNDLSVKLGHFAGILSYEQVPAVANFFYSHSYAMAMTEPLLVTGLLADYKLTDKFSIQAGFNRGWMMFEDLNNELDYMLGAKWALGEKTSLRYALDAGPQDPVLGHQNRVANSFLLEQGLSEKLRYVLQVNFGVENNGDPRTGQDAEWYGLNNYLFYTINPKWTAGLRAEWLCDADGLFYGPGNVPGNNRAWAGGPGFAGDWFEVSWGLNYRPCPNAVLRPELRYDWYDGTRDVKGNLPFDNGTKSYQLTVAADLIITY